MNPVAHSVAKKVGQVVVGFGLLFATALAFQNCSGYQMYDTNTQTDISSCGSSCDQSVDGLSLKLTNNIITIQNTSLTPNRVVDIAGYCDDAEFPDSKIQYQFVDGATALTDWVDTTAKCNDLGRFQIAADVPVVASARTLSLYVRLMVSLGGGIYLKNPAAQKALYIDIK